MQMRFAASLISVPYCYVAAEEFEIVTKASDSQQYPLSPMLADELCADKWGSSPNGANDAVRLE